MDATQSAEASCHHQSRSAATGRTHRGTQMTASPRGWPPAPQEAGSTAARQPGLTGGRNHRPQRIPRLLSQQKRITITTTQTRCARAGPQPRPAGPSAPSASSFLLTGESAHWRTGGKSREREQRSNSPTFSLYGGEKMRNDRSLSLEDFSTPPTHTGIKEGDTDRPSPSNTHARMQEISNRHFHFTARHAS